MKIHKLQQAFTERKESEFKIIKGTDNSQFLKEELQKRL